MGHSVTREVPPVKRIRQDRVVYTFALEPLPNETRQSALVIVWHEDGRLETHFVHDLSILKEFD